MTTAVMCVCVCVCVDQLLATIQRLQLSNYAQLATSQLQVRQTSADPRDDFNVNDLTSLIASSADDVQTVLKQLSSVSARKFVR